MLQKNNIINMIKRKIHFLYFLKLGRDIKKYKKKIAKNNLNNNLGRKDNMINENFISDQIRHMKQTEEGKFILCETKEPKATRLFIHRFSSYTSSTKKNGWWDTFTITNDPCNKVGYYICEILDFKSDKKDNLMCIVKPFVYIGKYIDEDSPAWIYIVQAHIFSNYADKNKRYWGRFNVDEVFKRFCTDIQDKEDPTEHVFFKLITERISLEDIEDALDTMDTSEQLAYDLIHNRHNFSVYKHLLRKTENIYTLSAMEEYIKRKQSEFLEKRIGTIEEYESLKYEERIEKVLEYYEAKKEEEKQLRKEARQNKKNGGK